MPPNRSRGPRLLATLTVTGLGVVLCVVLCVVLAGRHAPPALAPPLPGHPPTVHPMDHDPAPDAVADLDGRTWTSQDPISAAHLSDGHEGYDWQVPLGTPVTAALGGRVVRVRELPVARCWRGRIAHRGFGVDVCAWFNDAPHLFSYHYLSSVSVAQGDLVSTGDELGRSGRSGCNPTGHLHFSLRRFEEDGRSTVVDPFTVAQGLPVSFWPRWYTYEELGAIETPDRRLMVPTEPTPLAPDPVVPCPEASPADRDALTP